MIEQIKSFTRAVLNEDGSIQVNDKNEIIVEEYANLIRFRPDKEIPEHKNFKWNYRLQFAEGVFHDWKEKESFDKDRFNISEFETDVKGKKDSNKWMKTND